jgi:DUF4097 and DUF4098 domain-containing protein YvlB
MSRVLLSSALAVIVITGAPRAASVEMVDSGHPAQTTGANQDWCKDAGSYNDRSETFCEVRTLTGAATGRLEANTSNGSIAVTGTSRRDVSIQARVIAYAGSMADARELAGDVDVTLDGGRIRATGPRNSGLMRRSGWHVSYRVEVPSQYDLSLDTSNGSVNVTDVKGTIDTESSNGSLRLTNLAGRVSARTSNGSVEVQVSGSRWDGDGLTVVTSNGSARLDVPESYNANLIVGTSNGRINLDFPVTVQGTIGRRLETTLGSGGPTLEVRTSNGSVRVGRR